MLPNKLISCLREEKAVPVGAAWDSLGPVDDGVVDDGAVDAGGRRLDGTGVGASLLVSRDDALVIPAVISLVNN
jgi:hypothetical protein